MDKLRFMPQIFRSNPITSSDGTSATDKISTTVATAKYDMTKQMVHLPFFSNYKPPTFLFP